MVVVTDVGDVVAAARPPSACSALGVGAPESGAQAVCVVLVDAAGHESPGDCSAPIEIVHEP